jgi:endonuclease/exonuclease/phosphatase family metal-dependent hydrolase
MAPGPEMLSGPARPVDTFLTYNTHLFGRKGRNGDRETKLVYEDEKRADQICSRLRKNPHDVVGLNEVWDEELGRGMIESLQDLYPYHLDSPSAEGIQGIVRDLETKWPRLAQLLLPHIDGVIDFLVARHYDVGRCLWLSALKFCIREDWMTWTMEHILRLRKFVGAGLLFLSRYPIESWEFLPYPFRADLDRMSGKGILKAVVRTPEGRPLTVALTHLQEGASAAARKVRRRQIDRLAGVDPDVAMGDFNIQADQTREYQWARERLGLVDSYRTVHPDPFSEPGYTYEHNSPKNLYVQKLGIASAPGQGSRRIDFLFAKTGKFYPVSCRVPAEEFVSDNGGYYLSDHHAVSAAFVPTSEGGETPV